MPDTPHWYSLEHPERIDSPALLVYPARIRENIDAMIRIAGSPDRLRPHVKTHKMRELVKMQMKQGIHRFKCATIAEAEMLAMAGAKDILLAYQLSYTKTIRLIQLIRQYPEVRFASLVDNGDSARLLSECFGEEELLAQVWIDVDNGMHRTGHPPNEELVSLYKYLLELPHVFCQGLHIYDGHIHDPDFETRRQRCETDFEPVRELVEQMNREKLPPVKIIAGGTPTFAIHALHRDVVCSPGTCLLWDEGYRKMLEDQPFLNAAVLLTRIISMPSPGRFTTDLGHKAVAAENPVNKRIFFLNLQDYTVASQSEEHLVVEVNEETWRRHKAGDVLYGIPYHICPTVALYDEAQVVENGECKEKWEIIARKRRITI